MLARGSGLAVRSHLHAQVRRPCGVVLAEVPGQVVRRVGYTEVPAGVSGIRSPGSGYAERPFVAARSMSSIAMRGRGRLCGFSAAGSAPSRHR